MAGVQGHRRLLDRPRRAHLPGRQPPHQAPGLLGVDDPRGPGRPPRRALPGRGLHPAQGDVGPGRGRLHPELHLLHLAQRPSGSCATTWRRSPRGPRPTSCAPTSGPTPPTSWPAPCATAPPPPSASGCVLAATLVPSYGIYGGYELMRERARVGGQRGVPLLREVRDQAPRLGRPRLAGPVRDPAQRHPPPPPGPGRAGQHPLPRHVQRAHAGLLEAQRRRVRHRPRRRQHRPLRHPRGHGGPRPGGPGHARPAGPSPPTTSSAGPSTRGRARAPTSASTRGRRPTSSPCARTSRSRDGPWSSRARRRGRRAVVPEGRLLRGPHPGLLRRQQRRHRRPQGPHREARLPPVAGRRLPVAAALLPVAPARRRLRHLRLLHRPARVRRPGRRGGAGRRRPTSGACG